MHRLPLHHGLMCHSGVGSTVLAVLPDISLTAHSLCSTHEAPQVYHRGKNYMLRATNSSVALVAGGIGGLPHCQLGTTLARAVTTRAALLLSIVIATAKRVKRALKNKRALFFKAPKVEYTYLLFLQVLWMSFSGLIAPCFLGRCCA